MATTYDGAAIFGTALKVMMVVNPSAAQIDGFFGVTGRQNLYGGGRGRVFFLEGLLVGADMAGLAAAAATILSYDDGIGRVFVDDFWGTYDHVIFRRFEPIRRLPTPHLPYRVQFDGLL